MNTVRVVFFSEDLTTEHKGSLSYSLKQGDKGLSRYDGLMVARSALKDEFGIDQFSARFKLTPRGSWVKYVEVTYTDFHPNGNQERNREVRVYELQAHLMGTDAQLSASGGVHFYRGRELMYGLAAV